MTRQDEWTVSDDKQSTDESYPEYKVLEQLDQASRLWKNRGWKTDGLWSAKSLAEIEERVEKEAAKNPKILAFMMASKHHNRRKRILWSLLTATAAVTVIFAAWFVNSKIKVHLCMDAKGDDAIAWGNTEEKALENAFGAAGLYNSKDTHQRVKRLLDNYVADWSAVYNQACEANRMGEEQPNKILGLQLTCLNYRKQEFEALVETLTTKNVEVLRRAVEATTRLKNPKLCTDMDALLNSENMMVQPKNDMVLKRIEVLRYTLSTIKALETTGQYKKGLELVKQLVNTSDEFDYLPISAEVHYWAGVMQYQLAKYDIATQNFQKAYQYAAASNYDRMVAKALSQLVLVVGFYQKEHKRAKQWARLAQDAVKNPLVDAETKADYYNNIGMLHYSLGQYDQARIAMLQALEIRKKIFGPGHHQVATTLNNVANTFAKQGEYRKAQKIMKEVLTIREKLFGDDHVIIAKTLKDIGEALYQLGNNQAALNQLKRAADICKRTLDNKHPYLDDIEAVIEQIRIEKMETKEEKLFGGK